MEVELEVEEELDIEIEVFRRQGAILLFGVDLI